MKAAAGDGYDQMNNALRSTFVEFGERIAERFDRSLLLLRDDVRGIEDVNNNLRNTIEQMDVSFVRIADALKASTRHIDDNYQSLTGLSDRFKEISGEYEEARRENAVHTEDLIKNVVEAAQAVNVLTGDLRGEAQRRLDNFAVYESAINRMVVSAELIRDAVAVIPDQMYAYVEASKSPIFNAAASKYDNSCVYANADTNNGDADTNNGDADDNDGGGGGWSINN